MENIDSNKFKHNPSIISKQFDRKDDVMRTKTDIRVFIPERYIQKSLTTLGGVVKTLAIFAAVDKNNNYSLVMIPAKVDMIPHYTEEVMVDGTVNIVLHFEKDDIFIANTNVVQNASFMYDIFEEFYIRGNVPWFIPYSMLPNIFLESKRYAKSNIGNNPISMEILTAIIARDPLDKKTQFRKVINKTKTSNKPVYVGLNNIYYSYSNTGAKLIGGYYKAGVTNAIVDKENKATEVVSLLRN